MKTINIGIIGAGRIGKIHADHLLRMPGAKIAAIGDLFAGDELRSWAAERGIPVVTTNSNDIMEHPDIDAVLICSSTDTHVPLIKQAAANGKHIFCEKPVSMSVDQTREALAAVEAAGVSLQIGFNRRFDHNFSRVREIVSAGRIGDTHLIKITSRDPSPPHPDYIKVSGGLFMDMAIHDFDIARYLSGSEVVEVYAQGAVLVDPAIGELGDIDTALTTLRFENGALGVIDNSRKAVYGYDQRIEVFGSGGCVSADNDYPSTAVVSGPDGVTRDKPLYFFLERYKEAYMNETRQFIDSLHNGTAVPVSGHDALQAELIALAAKRSLQQGRPVKLAELTTGISSAG
ncbi:inositol 2-dehydrogenase [Paenibacillus sp. MDMC362]|uniref:inositol 2-dehydrogenase n=1 Tax=Paenibacillus sp. MDMC362 TaxID=2977365 RepID=UPI000DC3425C|nr:inositol 2-dehydrogenase [Paenibacillus sp. MDMC362]RAR45828.1 inositol 2-dehydrogenase [Paenibacillus sp. MDMC362]